MGLPCLIDKCEADCSGPQADPWDKSLVWDGCPGKAAHRRHDIEGALTVRGLHALGLTQSADTLAAWVVDVWAMIEAEKATLREARRDG